MRRNAVLEPPVSGGDSERRPRGCTGAHGSLHKLPIGGISGPAQAGTHSAGKTVQIAMHAAQRSGQAGRRLSTRTSGARGAAALAEQATQPLDPPLAKICRPTGHGCGIVPQGVSAAPPPAPVAAAISPVICAPPLIGPARRLLSAARSTPLSPAVCLSQLKPSFRRPTPWRRSSSVTSPTSDPPAGLTSPRVGTTAAFSRIYIPRALRPSSSSTHPPQLALSSRRSASYPPTYPPT